MGTPIFAVPILKSLYQNGYPVSVVYSQPPKKSSRGMKTQKSPVHLMAETLNIEARTPDVLKGNSIEENFLKNLDADLAIVVAYGKLLPESFLNLTKKGFINIHASILPSWRGAAPIQRAIINLDKKTGISLMKINNKLDSGEILDQEVVRVLSSDNENSLKKKILMKEHKLYIKVLKKLEKL